MREKRKQSIILLKHLIQEKNIDYSVKELLELGKKTNYIKLAKPLYDTNETTSNKHK